MNLGGFTMENENGENKSNFQAIKSYSNFGPSKKGSNSFSRNVILPFFSGVIGCSLVLGTCFGVPTIKEKLIGTTTTRACRNY